MRFGFVMIILLGFAAAVVADQEDRFKGTINSGFAICVTNTIAIPPQIPMGTVVMIR